MMRESLRTALRDGAHLELDWEIPASGGVSRPAKIEQPYWIGVGVEMATHGFIDRIRGEFAQLYGEGDGRLLAAAS